MTGITRSEITEYLSRLAEKLINPYNDTRIYWAREVTFDYATAQTKLKNIDTNRGFTKNHYKHLQYKITYNGYFLAVGNLDGVNELITNNISHIGKKTSQGFGEIAEWKFKEAEIFQYVVNGRLVRNIPISKWEKFKNNEKCDIENVFFAEKALVPPYWRSEKELCIY